MTEQSSPLTSPVRDTGTETGSGCRAGVAPSHAICPPFPTLAGHQFYAKNGRDEWFYVNHAGEWCGMPPLGNARHTLTQTDITEDVRWMAQHLAPAESLALRRMQLAAMERPDAVRADVVVAATSRLLVMRGVL